MQKTPSRPQKKESITFHVKMLRLNHIREEKQRQACMESQYVYLEASFEVCKALFKCCFRRVCSKARVKRRTSHEPNLIRPIRLMWSTAFDPGLSSLILSFAFDKTSFHPRRVARAKMGILKGIRRLVVSWYLRWIFYESLSFEHHCSQESYFVLWYFGSEFYFWLECDS